MQTIDITPTVKEGKQPNERYIPASELKIFLANVRKKRFKSDTFRRWRRVAAVSSTHAYSEFEQTRLAIVAQYLFEGGKLNSPVLKLKIRLQLLKEEKFNESRTTD